MATPTPTAAVSDTSAFGGPNAAQAASANAAMGVSTPSPISVSSLTQPIAPITVPPAPIPDTHAATNASIPTPPPTPEAILSAANAPTDAQNNQSGILGRIAELMRGKSSLTTLQTDQETQAGVPALSKTLKSITSQILGYNDQASKLALDASAGGTIENQARLDAQGLRSQQGQAPLTAAALSRNQIQQATIAGQALTAKAAYYAASDDYSLAKDAADKAAQVQFDAVQQQIDYQKSLLDAITPTLSREDAARAQLVSAQLADRQTQVNNQREDFKAGQGLAITAMKLNPNDAAAQNAAQQALKLDPNDPQYLTKVADLVAKFQQDPLATQAALDNHLQAQASIRLANANVAKINNDIKNSQPPITPTGTNAPYINAFNNATAGMGAQAQATASKVFAGYIAQGDLEGAKAYIIRTALANAPADQQNQAVGRTEALTAMNDISSLLAQAQAKGVNTNLLSGSLTNVANKLGTTAGSPDLNYIGSRILQALITYRKGMTGVAFGPQEAADYQKIFPDITNISNLNTAKISALQDSLNANNRAALSFYIGDTNYNALFPNQNTANLPSNQTQSTAKGQTTAINGHTYVSDGTQWVLKQ